MEEDNLSFLLHPAPSKPLFRRPPFVAEDPEDEYEEDYFDPDCEDEEEEEDD